MRKWTFHTRSTADSYDPDGLVGDSIYLTFIWTFSDGTISNESLVIHNFSTPGEHYVSLVVTDENAKRVKLELH